jgi:REP element-mobilizing transposase RayT
VYRPYYRRNLPHYQPASGTLFVTFRLVGSLPQHVIDRLQAETDLVTAQLAKLDDHEERKAALYVEYRRAFGRFDQALDRADTGPAWLKDAAIARLVADALHHRDGVEYRLIAYCIMPNHVHVVFAPLLQEDGQPIPLETILHSYKRYTARQANRILQREGAFWQHESYDHVIRDSDELQRIIAYVRHNPVKAGLIQDEAAWQWTYVEAM